MIDMSDKVNGARLVRHSKLAQQMVADIVNPKPNPATGTCIILCIQILAERDLARLAKDNRLTDGHISISYLPDQPRTFVPLQPNQSTMH